MLASALPSGGAVANRAFVNSTLKSVCCPQDGDDAKQGKVYVCDFANHRIGLLQLLPQRI